MKILNCENKNMIRRVEERESNKINLHIIFKKKTLFSRIFLSSYHN